MKFYYYCMSSCSKNILVGLMNMCAGKPSNRELDRLREEEIKLFEVTEFPMSNNVVDVFLSGHYFKALRADGTVADIDGNTDSNIPPVKFAVHRTLTGGACARGGAWYRGKDGTLYDSDGKEQSEDMLLTPQDSFTGYVKKDENGFQLLTPDSVLYRIPLARLKDMDTRFLTKDTEVQQWRNTHIDWENDIIEAKSKRVIIGTDGTCLFDWNGMIYSVAPQRNRWIRMGVECRGSNFSTVLDAVYREDYESIIDDIKQLVADNIYINHKGKLVFMQGWNDYTDSRCAKYEDVVIKAQKWENVVQCEVFGKHLVAKTKDGRVLTTFEPEICGNLKNIEHAFVSKEYSFFLVK